MHKLKVITRCTRIQFLEKIYNSLIQGKPESIELTWVIIFDTNRIKKIDCLDYLNTISKDNRIKVKIVYGKTVIENDYGHDLINQEIDATSNDSYIYVLDDDNKLHENFYTFVLPAFDAGTHRGILFNQYIGFKDFTNKEIRKIDLNNISVGQIDMGQFILHKSLLGDSYRIPKGFYVGDGMLISKIYEENRNEFTFLDEICSYYNFFQTEKTFWLPKTLYIGYQKPVLKTNYNTIGFEDRLVVKYLSDVSKFYDVLAEFNPDSIMIEEGMDVSFMNMINVDISNRAMMVNPADENIGTIAYRCAMNYILNYNHDDIVSYITPAYNTAEKLYKTYESLTKQTNINWEWILVDDSTDGGRTLEIIKEIASVDYRVKYFDFGNKSGGFIGESKYRGFMLANGQYLAEFDHDDYILPETTDLIIKAFKSNSEVGFVYSDSLELGINNETNRYPEGFGMGYGKYREEEYNGMVVPVIDSISINPKSIRHITGVPNHVRVWRRDVYYKIGGHKRRLSIADDYELIVRTFLETKMMHIPKLLYIQYIYNNHTGVNTHDLTRADIQRRVDYISMNYNLQIKNRFEELGVKDWAYEANPHYPILTPSKYGSEEGGVNLVYDLNK